MSKILTTHVGSLPRSQAVVDLLFAREHGKAYEQQEFDRVMDEAVGETVRRQQEIGIDIVSDGETSKISYATYVKDRYHGFTGDSSRNIPEDLKRFPQFASKISTGGGTPTYTRPECTGAVSANNTNDLNRDILSFKSALATHNVKSGFMNAASPGVIALFLPNRFYPSHEAYLSALADIMRAEYKAIINSGLMLQLDCPDLALSRHMLFQDYSDKEFVNLAHTHIDALNHALTGLPSDQIRIHICWGNYEGPHTCDIAMEKVLDPLMRVHGRYILFESSNPRHAHEWEVFQDKKNSIPDDKILVPGVLDTTTNFVEHPELIKQRLIRFTNIVGRDRVVAGTDCGFGTFAGFGAVDGEIAYAKLSSLVAGADLASQS